jgi:predicted RNA binding protein YcfA (HicA-like mRNA interferase family)
MQRVQENRTYTAIVPNHKEIKIGTLQSIIRQSGLEKALFEN